MFNYVSYQSSRTSVTNKHWHLYEPDARKVMAITQRYDVPEILARVLVNRGIELDEVEAYLRPTLRHFLPEPNLLKGMVDAVKRTIDAIQNKQSIVVYGDYDVDGATASALLRRYFEAIGSPIGVYIPDRIEEGYGANTEALLKLRSDRADLVLMVDCGTTAFGPLAEANEAGLDIIVLDHHTAEATLPISVAVVNPNRLDQPALPREEMRYLCAAGVTYFFVVALNRALREAGFFNQDIPEPDLRQYLDLVALGTVCDVMPLVGLNRAFVNLGLKVIAKRSNLGLAQLADIAKLSEKPSASHLGFHLGPRINAGGRVGNALLGSHILTSNDRLQTQEIATRLDAYNEERQAIERYVLEQALIIIESQNLHEHPVLLVGGQGWHPGVIGIVASRLKERFHKPTCVVGFDQGIGKGSGRSVPGVIMGDAMIKALHLGLLEKGGGHAMAAGFTVREEKFADFYAFLNKEMSENARASLPRLSIDGTIALSGLTMSLIQTLEQLEPFGVGNAQPRFLIKDITLAYVQPIGDGSHRRCRVQDSMGNGAKLMAFRVTDTPFEAALEKGKTRAFDAVVTVKNDTFNGQNSITLMLEDLAF